MHFTGYPGEKSDIPQRLFQCILSLMLQNAGTGFFDGLFADSGESESI